MTQDQIQASSKKKVDAIQALCNQMEVIVSAEQMITEKGFIKHVVYYTDNEKYEVDKLVTDKKNEPPKDNVQPSEGATGPGETGPAKPGESPPEA